LARAGDGLAEEALVAAPVDDDALAGTPAGLAHALATGQPDHVVGADGDHVRKPEPVPRAAARGALAGEAVGQHHVERDPVGEQVLVECNGHRRPGLGASARCEARLGRDDAEEQGAGRGPEQPRRMDHDPPSGQRLEIAARLVRDVVGRMPLRAVPGLVKAQDERRRPDGLAPQLQSLGQHVFHRPRGVSQEMLQRLGGGVHGLAQPRQ
jgi:hypothetical protein